MTAVSFLSLVSMAHSYTERHTDWYSSLVCRLISCWYFYNNCTDGQFNVTSTSLEHCNRLPQTRSRSYWFFLLRKAPQHRLTMLFSGPDRPQNRTFPLGSGPHLIHGSLGPPKSASRSVQQSFQGSRTWLTRPRYFFCSIMLQRVRPNHSADVPTYKCSTDYYKKLSYRRDNRATLCISGNVLRLYE